MNYPPLPENVFFRVILRVALRSRAGGSQIFPGKIRSTEVWIHGFRKVSRAIERKQTIQNEVGRRDQSIIETAKKKMRLSLVIFLIIHRVGTTPSPSSAISEPLRPRFTSTLTWGQDNPETEIEVRAVRAEADAER